MAIYHAHAKYIGRSSGRSTIAHAAYICAEQAIDERTGLKFDYRNKGDEVVYKNILLPKGFKGLNNTEILWNSIEKYEDELANKRYGNYKDAVKQAKSLAAKEKFLNEASISFCFEVSLPKELNLPEKIELSDRIAKELFGSKNLIVQYALHDKEGNPHVHYIANFRPIIDGKFSKSKHRFSRAEIKAMRKGLADVTNNYAKEKGYSFSIDHRSHAERGLKLDPTKHVGWYASKLNEDSRIVLENREIISKNTALLLKSPDEMLKVLIDRKTVFNLDELKKSAEELFGEDKQSIHVLKKFIDRDVREVAEELIDRAAEFAEFLDIAHKIRDVVMSSGGEGEDGESVLTGDDPLLSELQEERGALASSILDNIEDYRWLMSKVGMREATLESLSSSSLTWNDRALIVGDDVPEGLDVGETLSSLAKSVGNVKFDKSLITVFNLEHLGNSFKNKDVYINARDLELERDIVSSKSRLEEKRFGDMSLAKRIFKSRPSDNILSIIESQEKKQGYRFSEEQREAAINLVKENAFASLVGKAGTGKTTTLRSVAASYKKSGFRVIGTSFQGAAVGELGDSLNGYIDGGFTLSKLDSVWRFIDDNSSKQELKGVGAVNAKESIKPIEDIYELTSKTVVIVDEAGMAPRYLLKSLLERAESKGAKIIVVGDSGQIAAIDRGDVSRLLLEKENYNLLTRVVRQKNKGDVHASKDFAVGRIRSGFEYYNEKKNILVNESEFSSKLFLAHNVSNKLAEDGNEVFKHIVLAYKNSDVDDLNSKIQEIKKKEGSLAGNKIRLLTGYGSISSNYAKSLQEILDNAVIKSSLEEIRGNVVSITREKNKLSYNEVISLLEEVDVRSAEHKMLRDLFKPRDLYVNDRIRFTSNYNRGISGRQVYNGTLGVIDGYNPMEQELEVRLVDGGKVRVDISEYRFLDLGYALTINRSQGKDVGTCHLYLSNTNKGLIGSRELYVGATRHTDDLLIYTSKEYLGDKELYQKIGERWKMTASELEQNPSVKLVYQMEDLAEQKYQLWEKMQRDVRLGLVDLRDHEHFPEYCELKENLSDLAFEAEGKWNEVRIYASEADITLDDIERWIGDEVYEEDELLTNYRENRDMAQSLWLGIKSSKGVSWDKHKDYVEFKRVQTKRNELAYELAKFGNEQLIYDRSSQQKVTHMYNHSDKLEWSRIQKHSELYIRERIKEHQESKGKVRPEQSAKAQNRPDKQNVRVNIIERYNQQKELWDSEHAELKERIKSSSRDIVISVLGQYNRKLSNSRELRYGKSGKLTVKIQGNKSGNWYDFSTGDGGDLFKLVQRERGYSFREAAEYVRSCVGIESVTISKEGQNRPIMKQSEKSENQVEEKEDARRESHKQQYVENLYKRGKVIGNKSVAYRYLTQVRGIVVSLSSDLKTTGIYVNEQKKHLPVLIAYARDGGGNVTGGQYILLDDKTNEKAKLAVAKKSFGRISGSFVDIGQVHSKLADNNNSRDRTNNSKESQSITIIAEGIETGLSVKQSMREHRGVEGNNQGEKHFKFLCSLGISNIRNYVPSQGEKIIIAADNDGKQSVTEKTIKDSASILQDKGAFVEVVKPSKQGDFNDILRDKKNGGSKEIASSFKNAVTRHSANSLKEYFGKEEINTHLDKNDKSNLAYIEKYDLPQAVIVDAYRKSLMDGKLELESMRKSLEMAVNNLSQYEDIFNDARQWGYQDSKADMTKSLIGLSQSKSSDHINNIRNEYLANYLEKNLSKFRIKDYTYEFAEQKSLIIKEQSFLKETFELAKVSDDLTELYGDNKYIILAGKAISKNPEKLDILFKKYEKIQSDNIRTERELCRDMRCSCNIDTLIENANITIECHHLKTIPAELAEVREKADSINKAFIAIEKEQSQLANQHGKIQYIDFETELLNKCELAYIQRENNSLSDLKETVNQALELGAKTEEELVSDLRQVTDLESAQKDLRSYIEERQFRRAVMIVQRDINIVEKYDAQGKEQDVVRFLTEKKEVHSDLKLKLQNSSEERSLNHLTNRLRIAEIYDHNKSIDVKLANQLKIEMLFMHRISRIGTQEAIKFSEEHDLEKSVSFVKKQNIQYAITELYKQSDVLVRGKNHSSKGYINSIATDKGLMRYVDEVLSTPKRYNIDDNKKEVLLQYSNQRDIDVILKGNKYNRSDSKLLNDNIDNLHRFANTKALKEGLSILEKQGIKGLENYTEVVCTRNITEAISKDCTNIRRGRDVELLEAEYSRKTDYLTAISQDETIMKYINLSLDKCRDTELRQDLLLCSNQHNIHKILESFKGSMRESKEFKDNIAAIQRFGQVQNMSDILESYKSKGISAMTRYASDICEHNITEAISKDCTNIRRGRDVELLEAEYSRKTDYLTAISQDETIMKYIKPRSEIGQEIAKLQEVENVKTKGFDFER